MTDVASAASRASASDRPVRAPGTARCHARLAREPRELAQRQHGGDRPAARHTCRPGSHRAPPGSSLVGSTTSGSSTPFASIEGQQLVELRRAVIGRAEVEGGDAQRLERDLTKFAGHDRPSDHALDEGEGDEARVDEGDRQHGGQRPRIGALGGGLPTIAKNLRGRQGMGQHSPRAASRPSRAASFRPSSSRRRRSCRCPGPCARRWRAGPPWPCGPSARSGPS